MNSFHGLVVRAAAIVAGSAIVGACIASNPATAQDVNSMLQTFGITTCSTSGPCKEYKNNGSGAGLAGVANSGNGVIAYSKSGNGIYTTSTYQNGVQAYSNNNDGTNSGTDNNSTTNVPRSGVWGHDDSTDGGVYNVGVAGSSNYGKGVWGSSTNGLGIVGSSTNGIPFLAFSSVGGEVWSDLSGNFFATGGFYANEMKVVSPVTTTDGRHIASFVAQSADAELSDVGTGRIAGGHGVVQLDPAFARTLDMRSGYHVFLTPKGDSKGLYISSESPAGFEVRESQGGQSSLSFDYRITGRPAGVTSGRLPIVRFSAPKIMAGRTPFHTPNH